MKTATKAPTAYRGIVDWYIALCPDTQSRAYLDLGLCCGLRPAEMVALRWQDIDFVNRTVYVRCGKGGVARTVGLAVGQGWIEKHSKESNGSDYVFTTRRGKPWATSHVRRMFLRLSEQTGKRLSPHSLRHGNAVAVAEWADRESPTPMATVYKVQRQLGHANWHTTLTYLTGVREQGSSVSRMAI